MVSDGAAGGTGNRGAGDATPVSVGCSPAPWGHFALAVSGRKVVAAAPGSSREVAIGGLRIPGGEALVEGEADDLARVVADRLVAGVGLEEVLLELDGTAFQLEVWEALRGVPFGTVRTYSDLASSIGRPRAVRAVASACAANRVGLIVPCHRVIRADGSLGGYRWGEDLKRRVIAAEFQAKGDSADLLAA